MSYYIDCVTFLASYQFLNDREFR